MKKLYHKIEHLKRKVLHYVDKRVEAYRRGDYQCVLKCDSKMDRANIQISRLEEQAEAKLGREIEDFWNYK